jgi:hypothetical protein
VYAPEPGYWQVRKGSDTDITSSLHAKLFSHEWSRVRWDIVNHTNRFAV